MNNCRGSRVEGRGWLWVAAFVLGLLVNQAGAQPVYERVIQPGERLYQAVKDIPPGSYAHFRVMAGTYTNQCTNLWINGEWIFENVKLKFIDTPTNTGGWGIFDDRFSGSVTCKVSGVVDIEYSSGTNVSQTGPPACTYGYNTNALGAIVVTNPATRIDWTAHTTIGIYGIVIAPSAVYVENCSPGSTFLNFDKVYNLNPAAVVLDDDCDGIPLEASTACVFLTWNQGTMHCSYRHVTNMTQYAVTGYSTRTNGDELHIEGDFIDGKWYLVGRTNNWRVWSKAREMRNMSGTSDLINLFSAGSYYFEAQKMSTMGGHVLNTEMPEGVDTNLQVWLDVQKISGSNGWLRSAHGAIRGRVGHFEQNGPNNGTPQITVTNSGALISLSGEEMNGANTLVSHGGGRTALYGYRAWSTNVDPLLVAGNGLELHGVTVDTVSGTNWARAVNAATVNVSALNTTKPTPTNLTVLSARRRTLANSTTPIASAGTAVTNLAVVHVPAHQLTNAGTAVEATFQNRYSATTAGANSNALIYGSTTILNTGAQASSNCSFTVQARITSVGPTSQNIWAALTWAGSGTPYLQTNVLVRALETNGVATALRLTTHQPNAGGVTNETYVVEVVPNP